MVSMYTQRGSYERYIKDSCPGLGQGDLDLSGLRLQAGTGHF